MNQPAVVNYANEPGAVSLQEIPRPDIGEDDVLLEVAAVGVCGSDLHQWTAQHSWPVRYPVVLGHEFGGVIAEVGSRVIGFTPGERAVRKPRRSSIRPTRFRGKANTTSTRRERASATGSTGAMTKYVRVPARCLHRIPEGLSFEKACLTEPCSVAYNAVVNHGSIKPGDRILVLGPGPIGLLCAAMARLQGGIVAVCGIERDAQRLEIARQYGCEVIVGDARDWAYAADGLGADGIIDAAGVSATLELALQVVRPGGWISKVGWGREPLGFSLDPLVQKNIRLQGSFSHNWPIWERVLRLLATGLLDVQPIMGGVWPLTQWQTAFEKMHSGEIAKAVLNP